ncbi:hypothetical protein ACVMB2_002120 [Sinorhizobium meliloti]
MARETLPVALELMFGDEKRRGFCFPKHKRPAIRPRITGQLYAPTRSIWARLVDPPPVSNEPLAAVNEAAPNRSKPQIRSSNHSANRLNGLVLTGRKRVSPASWS